MIKLANLEKPDSFGEEEIYNDIQGRGYNDNRLSKVETVKANSWNDFEFENISITLWLYQGSLLLLEECLESG